MAEIIFEVLRAAETSGFDYRKEQELVQKWGVDGFLAYLHRLVEERGAYWEQEFRKGRSVVFAKYLDMDFDPDDNIGDRIIAFHQESSDWYYLHKRVTIDYFKNDLNRIDKRVLMLLDQAQAVEPNDRYESLVSAEQLLNRAKLDIERVRILVPYISFRDIPNPEFIGAMERLGKEGRAEFAQAAEQLSGTPTTMYNECTQLYDQWDKVLQERIDRFEGLCPVDYEKGKLQYQLKQAVQQENYEKAAELRDLLKDL